MSSQEPLYVNGKLNLAAVHAERKARTVEMAPRAGEASQPLRSAASPVPNPWARPTDWRQTFDVPMEARVGHVVSFVVLAIFAANAALRLLFLNVVGAAWSLGIGLAVAAAIARFGPGLVGCQTTPFGVYSSDFWFRRMDWATAKHLEYESFCEVLIFYCTYRKTNCLTGTLYGGPRDHKFIASTVWAKVTELSGQGQGGSIFAGCQAPVGPGARTAPRR
jgi:hypothetical protein